MISVPMVLINEYFFNLCSFHRALILIRFIVNCEKDELRGETDFNIEYFANFRCERTIDSADAKLSLELPIESLDLREAFLAGTRLAKFRILEIGEPFPDYLVFVHELRHHVLGCDLCET
jgi:hypothetical protein